MKTILRFSELGKQDISMAGGKEAHLDKHDAGGGWRQSRRDAAG
jgi:hypothetical protein